MRCVGLFVGGASVIAGLLAMILDWSFLAGQDLIQNGGLCLVMAQMFWGPPK